MEQLGTSLGYSLSDTPGIVEEVPAETGSVVGSIVEPLVVAGEWAVDIEPAGAEVVAFADRESGLRAEAGDADMEIEAAGEWTILCVVEESESMFVVAVLVGLAEV